jgi:hypothetical protein
MENWKYIGRDEVRWDLVIWLGELAWGERWWVESESENEGEVTVNQLNRT